MRRIEKGSLALLGAGALALVLAACGGSGGSGSQGGGDGGAVGDPLYTIGDPLVDLTAEERTAFADGLASFKTVEDEGDGLGPVFNGTSCSECHQAGSVGGAALNDTIARVTRIGGIRNGAYSDLSSEGGPVLQSRSLREFIPDFPLYAETVPADAQFVSHRMTTPLFGAGLIEAIPAATILARTKLNDPDGVHGEANIIHDPETGKDEVGRFGWKAQMPTLHLFAGDAYLNEMGITTASFPSENLPEGLPMPDGCDTVADPEDHDGDAEKFAAFMRFLAPPTPLAPTTISIEGSKLFDQARCTACHVPLMVTGSNSSNALAHRNVRLYSDLLLHHMGPALADGIQQGKAKGDQFKTAPLWGLSHRQFFLHDGQATTVEDAIMMHGGEATKAKGRFMAMTPDQQAAVIVFLSRL